jgi:hypothetical protein
MNHAPTPSEESSGLLGGVAAPKVPPSWELFSDARPYDPRKAAHLLKGDDDEHQAPVHWREVISVIALVILADLAWYRGHGYAGYALLFVAAPLLLLCGAPRPSFPSSLWGVTAMLWALSAKLVWGGTALQVTAGFILLATVAMLLAGIPPYIGCLWGYVCQIFPAGGAGLMHYGRSSQQWTFKRIPRDTLLNVVLPCAAVFGFGTLFILANPNLVTSVAESLRRIADWIFDATAWLMPTWLEIFFWFTVTWIVVGLLRPVMRNALAACRSREAPHGDASAAEAMPAETALYAPCRNTLVAVIVLFAAYLVFEFATLWFRKFPQGFYYSGYAHEGAAWLTVALAAATAVLSLMFRAQVLQDPRISELRRWAWIWSAENLLLSLAVYNRLQIYVNFNGMTRMRVVGLLGISAVVVGFLLVIRKITHGHDFVWLVRRQLWVLAAGVYLYALMPVDSLVHSYNVRRILAGDPAPAVQISVHPIDAGGLLVLYPLTHAANPVIREGLRALLAERAAHAEVLAQRRSDQGWSSFQLADFLFLEKLRRVRGDWEEDTDPAQRTAALTRFREYAYQWY